MTSKRSVWGLTTKGGCSSRPCPEECSLTANGWIMMSGFETVDAPPSQAYAKPAR